MWTCLQAWEASAAMLGVRLEGPCKVDVTPTFTLRADMLVRDFGAPKGTLVFPSNGYDPNAWELAREAGYAASGLAPYADGVECSLASMIDALSDWGWTGMGPPPRWLIHLDAMDWTEPSDLFDALFPALGAPRWHGDNLNALYDSIVGGGINGLEPPFAICVFNTKALGADMRDLLAGVAEVFADAGRSGLPVLLNLWP